MDGLSQRYGYAMQLAWKSNTEDPAIPLKRVFFGVVVMSEFFPARISALQQVIMQSLAELEPFGALNLMLQI